MILSPANQSLLGCLAIDMEIINCLSTDALQFFIGLIILHETTHYGDATYNQDMYIGEEGNDLELKVTGTEQMDIDDAELIYQNYLLKINE